MVTPLTKNKKRERNQRINRKKVTFELLVNMKSILFLISNMKNVIEKTKHDSYIKLRVVILSHLFLIMPHPASIFFGAKIYLQSVALSKNGVTKSFP